ncbi:MAG: hypothetical protein IJ538_03540 [Clostridia bacterium]|nr:hypothetical protein [Clostridia bacterium]
MDLMEYNAICKSKFEKLESYELIEKILFSKEEIEQIGKLLYERFHGNSHPWNIIEKFKEVISIFLVGSAKYFYNNGEGGFWDAVQRMTYCSQTLKQDFIKAFKSTLNQYNLENFNEERVAGYTQMGSMLAHAGLPENLENSLIEAIISLKYQKITFDKLGDELLIQDLYLPKSLKSYLQILNKLGTINDFIYDVMTFVDTSNNSIDESSNLPITLQEKIIYYKNDKKNHEYARQRIITKPELFIDTDTNQFFITFPEYVTDEDENLTWYIQLDEQIIKKCIISEFIKQKYYFRAATLKIIPCQNIKASLKDDNNQTIIDFVIKETGQALVFNEKGEYSRNNYLTNKGGYVLIDDNYSCDDLEPIESFDFVNLFQQPNSKSIYNLIFKNTNDNKDLKIPIKNPIELSCEDKLFSQNCSFLGLDGYYTLPQIFLPMTGTWLVRIDVEGNIYNKTLEITEDNETLDLSTIISSDEYGKVSIRLNHKQMGTKTFRFIYLPYISVYISSKSNKSRNKTISINFEETKNIFITDLSGNKQTTFFIPDENDYFEGYYNYLNKKYQFRFTVRSYTWTFENNNQLLGFPNTLLNLSIKDISANGNCLLTIKNNTPNEIYLIFDNGTNSRIPIKIKENSKKYINLKDYIEYLSSNTERAYLYLEENFNKICDLCSIKKNIAIHNFIINNSYNIINITWEEDGLKKNRVLRCRDIKEPYNYFDIDIPDGETSLVLDMDETGFTKNLILEIVFKKSNNIFETDTEDEEILDESNTTIFNLYAETPYLYEFKNGDYNNLKNAIFTFITYRFNKKIYLDTNVLKKQLTTLLTYIYLNRFIFGDEKIIEILMNYKLTTQQYMKIRKDFGLLYPILRKGEIITSNTYKKLEQYDKLLYVVYVFIKRDDENLEHIMFNSFSYLEKFTNKSTTNIIWEKVQDLLPGIKNHERIEKLKNKAVILFPEEKEIELYIDSLISDFADVYNREKNNFEYRELAKYIETLDTEYSRLLIDTIFKQLSKRNY